MKRQVIVVRVRLFISDEEQERLEQEIRTIIARQQGMGVLVLPNWAEYAGVFEEDTDQGFRVEFDRDHIDPECWDLIQRIKAGEGLPKLDPRDGGQGLSKMDPRNAGGGEGLIKERKG